MGHSDLFSQKKKKKGLHHSHLQFTVAFLTSRVFLCLKYIFPYKTVFDFLSSSSQTVVAPQNPEPRGLGTSANNKTFSHTKTARNIFGCPFYSKYSNVNNILISRKIIKVVISLKSKIMFCFYEYNCIIFHNIGPW